MPDLKLESFCLIHQQEDMTRGKGKPAETGVPSWTLSYRLRGETGYNVHIVSEAYAKRLMAILQGAEDEGGFTIPFLPQKLYSAEQTAKGLARAVRSTNLALAGKAEPADDAAQAAAAARERMNELLGSWEPGNAV